MRVPRNVTITPIGIPCRTLNCATDLRARRVTGCWPVISLSSFAPTSINFEFCVAAPSPMLTTTRSIFGTAITLA